MRLLILFLPVVFFLLVLLSFPVSDAVELARVGDSVITSGQYLEDFRYAVSTDQGPERTFEGKKEFLDRIIARHILSSYFRSRGWDTLSVGDTVLRMYEKSIYLQALYRDAMPEIGRPGAPMGLALIEPSRKFVDSLTTAYDVRLQQDAIALLSNKSVGLVKTARTDREGLLIFRWSPLFTDEEKRLVAAAFLGDELTVGEFAAEVDKMPRFARPMAGNFTQISDTVEQLVRDEIFRHEFEKRKLRNQAWFKERMTSKKEELMADQLFTVMTDTCAITEEEMKRYYEEHRDNFVTLTGIKLAAITVESENLAKEIARRISEGKSFESVAVDFSVYSSSELGYDTTDFIPRSKWTSVYDAIWDKRIGEVAGPVYLPEDNVWVMAKLLARQNPRLLSFEEAVPKISERLKLAKADDAVVRLIGELRDKADVKIDYDALEKLELPETPRD